jgi:hypothetical protein
MLASLAAVLLLAAGDPPAPLDLAPLVPTAKPTKPAIKAKPKQKKKAPAPAKPGAPIIASPPSAPPALPLPALVPPPPEEKKPAAVEAELPLPPLVTPPPAQPAAPPPPPPVKPVNETGVLVQLESPALQEGLREVIRSSPRSSGAELLTRPAQPCDDACISALATAAKLDRLLVATYADGSLRVRLIDVAANRELASSERAATDAQLVAVGESLACQLLIPLGCSGEVEIAAPDAVDLAVDGQPLPRAAKQKLQVGVHEVTAVSGPHSAKQTVAIVRESNAPLYVSSEPRFSDSPPAPPAAVATSTPVPSSSAHPMRTVTYSVLGAAVVAGGIGTFLGVSSRSDINSAENAFHANGGAYRPSDLSTLNSGNSKARTANILFATAGVLAVTGGVLAFAF